MLHWLLLWGAGGVAGVAVPSVAVVVVDASVRRVSVVDASVRRVVITLQPRAIPS